MTGARGGAWRDGVAAAMTWPADATSSSIRGAALRVVRAAGRKAWLVTHSAMSAWVAMGLINLLWQTYSAVICPRRVSYAMCVQLHGVQQSV